MAAGSGRSLDERGTVSFDIHLQCYRNGDFATFKRALVEEIFRRDAVDLRLPLTHVDYPDGSGGQISEPTKTTIYVA